MKKNKKSVLIPFLFFLSALLALYPLYKDLSLALYKNKKNNEFNQKLKMVDNKDTSKIDLTAGELSVVAMLYIPSINLSLPVYDTFADTEEKSLQLMSKAENNGAALWYQLDDLNKGLGSRSLLSSHNGLSSNDLFTNLEHLRFNDKFYLKTLDGDIRAYKISEIDKAYPNGDLEFRDSLYNDKVKRFYKKDGVVYEIDNNEYNGYKTKFKTKICEKINKNVNTFYNEKDKEFVTLQTCVPIFQNTHRLLVTGERVPYSNEELPYYNQVKIFMLLCLVVVMVTIISFIKIIMNIKYNREIEK